MFVFDVLLALICTLCLYCNLLPRETLLSWGKDIGKQKAFEGQRLRFVFMTCVLLFVHGVLIAGIWRILLQK